MNHGTKIIKVIKSAFFKIKKAGHINPLITHFQIIIEV